MEFNPANMSEREKLLYHYGYAMFCKTKGLKAILYVSILGNIVQCLSNFF